MIMMISIAKTVLVRHETDGNERVMKRMKVMIKMFRMPRMATMVRMVRLMRLDVSIARMTAAGKCEERITFDQLPSSLHSLSTSSFPPFPAHTDCHFQHFHLDLKGLL